MIPTIHGIAANVLGPITVAILARPITIAAVWRACTVETPGTRTSRTSGPTRDSFLG